MVPRTFNTRSWPSRELHRAADVQHPVLDVDDLVAVGVFEDERRAGAHRLAVDLEHLLAVVVLDPVVVTDREQLLAHHKLPSIVVVSEQAHVSAFLGRVSEPT
jgi:hypothetical protein